MHLYIYDMYVCVHIYICITLHMTTCCTISILKSLGRSEAESSIFSPESWDLQSLLYEPFTYITYGSLSPKNIIPVSMKLMYPNVIIPYDWIVFMKKTRNHWLNNMLPSIPNHPSLHPPSNCRDGKAHWHPCAMWRPRVRWRLSYPIGSWGSIGMVYLPIHYLPIQGWLIFNHFMVNVCR